MGLPTPPFNPNTPIPNNPFQSPQTYTVNGLSGPTIVGDGLYVDYANLSINSSGSLITGIIAGLGISVSSTVGNITVSNTGVLSLNAGPGISISGSTGNITISSTGSGSGTVTSITASTGLTGGTITTSGTIALANTTVNAGSYTFASFTVDPQGRLTAASNGSVPTATPTTLGLTFAGPGDLITGNSSTGYCALSSIPSVTISERNTALGVLALRLLTNAVDNTAVGYSALNSNLIGSYNTVIGSNAGFSVTGSKNVVIGAYVNPANVAGNCQLAIGPSGGFCWLTGNSTLAIKPGAGIIDCAGSCGTAGQVLMSNGSNAICWGTVAAGSGIPCACITAKGALVTGTAASTPVGLTVGTDGQVLTACAACTTGLTWAAGGGGGSGTVTDITAGTGLTGGTITTSGTVALDTACVIPPTAFTQKGEMLIGTGAGTYTVVAPGTPGQYLTYTSPKVGCNAIWTDPVGVATPGDLGLGYGFYDTSTSPNSMAAGQGSLGNLIGGDSNTALGFQALVNLSTGSRNIGLGFCAGSGLTTETDNVLIGSSAGNFDTLTQTVAIGSYAGTKATNSVFIGYCAIQFGLRSCNSVVIGANALNDNAYTGCQLVAIGPNVSIPAFNTSCQLAIGFSATDNWLTGDPTKAIKPGAGIIDCAGSCGTAGQVLSSTGTNNILWASGAAAAAATPNSLGTIYGCTTTTSNSFLGYRAGTSQTDNCRATLVGRDAGFLLTTGDGNTGVGSTALCSVVTGCFNTAVGDRAMQRAGSVAQANTALGVVALEDVTGAYNVALGVEAGLQLLAGNCNVFLGAVAARDNTSGNRNVVIGPNTTTSTLTVSCELVIGYNAGQNWLTGDSTKAIKPGAGIIDCTGSCGTAGQALLSDGANAVCWGSVSAAKACPTTLGTVYGYVGTNVKTDASIGIGLCSMVSSTPTNTPTNAALGFGTLCSLTTGGGNVAMGWRALVTMTTGSGNTVVGAQAGTAASGTENAFVGSQSGCQVAGNQNSFFGICSGATQVSGDSNVAIGFRTALASTTGSCQLAIGFSDTENWLTGDSTKAIKPGAGIIDSTNVCGTANQVLVSTGANAIQWKSVNSALAVPNYGSFNSTTTQTVGTINVGQPITLSTVSATGFSIVGGSQITAASAGTYNIQISLQIISTSGGGGLVEVWFVKNGTAITNSNTRYSVKNANEEEVAALNLVETLTAGQNIQVYWASDNVNMTLATLTSTMGGPAIPSAIVTVVPVGA